MVAIPILQLLLLLLPAMIAAQATMNNSNTLVTVACPDDVQTFTAETTMVFQGRMDMPTMEEEMVLRAEFENVYNTLAATSCDSFFRRISNLTMIRMRMIGGISSNSSSSNSNSNSSAMTTTTTMSVNRQGGEGGGMRRILQNSTLSNVNTTSDDDGPGVEMIYRLVGTCRGCALTRSGSFDLYDEAFRRYLRSRNLLVAVQEEEYSTRSMLKQNKDDCQCVEGALPLAPQAPGVQQCVDAMNLKFDNLQEAAGLFVDLRLTDLIQLVDEGVDSSSSNSTEIDIGNFTAAAPTPAPTPRYKVYGNLWS